MVFNPLDVLLNLSHQAEIINPVHRVLHVPVSIKF